MAKILDQVRIVRANNPTRPQRTLARQIVSGGYGIVGGTFFSIYSAIRRIDAGKTDHTVLPVYLKSLVHAGNPPVIKLVGKTAFYLYRGDSVENNSHKSGLYQSFVSSKQSYPPITEAEAKRLLAGGASDFSRKAAPAPRRRESSGSIC